MMRKVNTTPRNARVWVVRHPRRRRLLLLGLHESLEQGLGRVEGLLGECVDVVWVEAGELVVETCLLLLGEGVVKGKDLCFWRAPPPP